MTGEELYESRRALRWSRETLGELIGCSKGLIKHMEGNRREVPPSVARWLQEVASWLERHPPPQDWRTWSKAAPRNGEPRMRVPGGMQK